ncbi:ATP-dependent RNA helicase HrpA [Marinimicrobium sp. ARAG 43.8]|uniref:ATP-dependent RNA helicase HrpA n=1 Tax=Marinimicrobium sp. ARAG 43.8 TaxID=3418719 RepID=UPI003CF7D327
MSDTEITPPTSETFPEAPDFGRVLSRDRFRLLKGWQAIRAREANSKPVDQDRRKWLEQWHRSRERVEQRAAYRPTAIHYPELPISERRDEIAEAIRDHQVVVLAGETGSGKTTQLPKICLELGRGVNGMIGHTQPRRVAAHSVAQRIAEELNSPLGEMVGYQVRFTDQSSDRSLVKVMTDGILLAEIQNDRFLSRYDTLIIDEAHERSLNIDFLLGFLKQLLPKRPDLKVIITSATIDLERFSQHFDNAPIIEVSGRTYPVDVWYRPVLDSDSDGEDSYQPVLDAISEIEDHERHSGNRGGDILVFMSGEREIREASRSIRQAGFRHLDVLPFYARLSMAEQQKVFAPHKGRRVVLATNVAETSITVPGIRYVIDPGYARLSRYSYRTKVQRLPVEPISQASANQRKGRCGRVSEGICIRLYSEDDFLSRPAFTDAEIVRTNLAAVILQMLQLRMGDIQRFPFIDPPDRRLINDGYKLLEELQAVTTKGRLTTLGRQLTGLPLDPRLGRMLLAAAEQGSLREALVITSALSVQDPRERPADKQQAADQLHRRFWHEQSDFLGFVQLWDYFEQLRQELSQNQMRKQCKKEFLNYLRWREWRDIHHQLKVSLKGLKLSENREPADYEAVHRSLLTGLLGNLGFNIEEREYLGARNRKFLIFPGSSQFRKTPKWLMAAELLETSRLYAHTVAKIDPQWALAAAGHLVKRQSYEPHYDTKSGRVKAYEKVTLYGLVLVEKQRIDFTDQDPKVSREVFIRAALVEGRYVQRGRRGKPAPFFEHNRKLVAELNDLEAKSRRRDIVADDEVLFQFYDERIPDNVVSRASFDQWRQEAERTQPKLLFIEREQLMQRDAGEVSEAQFPDELVWRGTRFPLKYQFEPGNEDDGVNLQVPVSLLHQVPERRLEWLVPGLLRDKCISLVKGLPKQWRRHFVPVPDVVDRALSGLKADNVSLTDALTHQLKRQTLVEVPVEAWDATRLDDFYRMNVQVLDERGRVIARGRDLATLRERYREQAQEKIQSAAVGIERENITGWDWDELPEQVQLRRAGIELSAFPALVDKGSSVSIEVLDEASDARWETRQGLARLVLLELSQTAKYLHKELLKKDELALSVAEMGKRQAVVDDLLLAVAAETLPQNALPRTREDYVQFRQRVQETLVARAQERAAVLSESLTRLVSIKKQIKALKSQLPLAFTLSDIRNQLDHLFFPGVLYRTPEEWFRQYPRYLQALSVRLEKAPLDARKDRLLLDELVPFWERLEPFWSEREGRALLQDEALQNYRWSLEEFRVSLFAQTLKTRFPVSGKRLDRRWRDWEKQRA